MLQHPLWGLEFLMMHHRLPGDFTEHGGCWETVMLVANGLQRRVSKRTLGDNATSG